MKRRARGARRCLHLRTSVPARARSLPEGAGLGIDTHIDLSPLHLDRVVKFDEPAFFSLDELKAALSPPYVNKD